MPRNHGRSFLQGLLAASALWLAAAGWILVQRRTGVPARVDSTPGAAARKAARGAIAGPVPTARVPSAGAEGRSSRPADSTRAAALRSLTNRVRAERLREGVLLAYGPFAARLHLDDATRAALLELLARERTAAGDALQAAQALGVKTGEGAIAAVEAAIQTDRSELARLLGPEAFAQLESYEHTLPEALALERLAAALPTAEGLNESQASQLSEAIYQREPPEFNAHPAFTAAIGLKDAPLSHAMLTAASAFLTPPQFQALQSIAADQRERAQLQQAWTAAARHPLP